MRTVGTPRGAARRADLHFSLDLPGGPVGGTLATWSNRVAITLDQPEQLTGVRDLEDLRRLAAVLATGGVTVVVDAGDVALLQVGRPSSPAPARWLPVRRKQPSRHLALVGGSARRPRAAESPS